MPVHYGSKALNNVTVSSPLSKHQFIQPHKFPKLLVLDTLSGPLSRTRQQLVIWEREPQARVISLQPSTSQQPYAAKLYFCAETTNTPSPLQSKINTFPTVSFQEPFHSVLQALELMETMLWPFYMPLKKLENILSRKESHTSWSL